MEQNVYNRVRNFLVQLGMEKFINATLLIRVFYLMENVRRKPEFSVLYDGDSYFHGPFSDHEHHSFSGPDFFP